MHVPVGINKLCQNVLSFNVWQRYALTFAVAFLLLIFWYLMLYQTFAKKYSGTLHEIVVIEAEQKVMQGTLATINGLENDCHQIKSQLSEAFNKSGQQPDLLMWYGLMSKSNAQIENCTSEDLVFHDWYSTKKIMCSLKSSFEQLMLFFENLQQINQLYTCDELSINKSGEGQITCHGIFQQVNLKDVLHA